MSSTNLTTCKDCGHEVSKRANKCPYCGAPRTKIYEKASNIVAVVLIVLFFPFLIFYLPSEISSFWKSVDPIIIEEYNGHQKKMINAIENHDLLIEKIRNASSYERTQLEKDYISKVPNWNGILWEFKSFIEANYKRIERIGINPDYSRDDVKDIIKLIKENEMRFRQLTAIQNNLSK